MDKLDKLMALKYLANNNPLCDNCARADLEEIRIAAGLYGVVREMLNSPEVSFTTEAIDEKIRKATAF